MADVKWIKMSTGLPGNRKLKQIRKLPEGDSIALMWVFLMCLAGDVNEQGLIYLTPEVPYTDEMLAEEFNMEINTIRLGLATFQKFGMIEIVEDVICLSAWEKWQSVDRLSEIREYNRLAKQKSRAKQKQKLLETVNDKSMTSQRCHDTDKEEDKERDKEEDIKDIISDSDESAPAPVKKKPVKKKPVKHKHGEYKHVLLTDSEYEKLGKDFGNSMRTKVIKFLDEYIEEKDYESKSHNMAIRRWVVDAVKERERKQGRKEMVPDWMKKKTPRNSFNSYSDQRDYDFDALEKELFENAKTVDNDPELAARAEALKKKLGGV